MLSKIRGMVNEVAGIQLRRYEWSDVADVGK